MQNIDCVINKLKKEFDLVIPEDYVDFVKGIDMFQYSWDIIEVGEEEIEINHFLGYDVDVTSRDLYKWYLFADSERLDYLTFAMGFGNEEFAIKVKGDNLGEVALIAPDQDGNIEIKKICNNFSEFIKKFNKGE